MSKKIDYASMFTRRKDGRYQHFDSKRTPKFLYDRDPEQLYYKVEAAKNPTAPLFKDAAEMWQDWKWPKISAGTKVCYGPSLRRAIEENGDKPIDEITSVDISNHLEKLKIQGYSKKVVSTQKTVYVMIFRFIITVDNPRLKGWVKYNPATEIKLPRGLPERKGEAPEDDVIDIIRANTDKPFGLFPRLLLNTGFRESEAAPLTWGDTRPSSSWGPAIKREIVCDKAVEYSDPNANIKETKTEAGERAVPVLPDLEPHLIRPPGAKDTDLIFPGKSGGVMTAAELRRAWTNWCRAAGLSKIVKERRGLRKGKPYYVNSVRPTITPHQLRHYYATMLFEADVDELTAQRLLGHADIQTTRAIYTHLRNKQKNKSVNALVQYQAERFNDPDSDIILT